MSIISNTWKDYKITICSTVSAAAASLGIAYFVPQIKGVIADSITVAIPTLTSLLIGSTADKNRTAKEKLETILYSTDQTHQTGVVSMDTQGTVKNFIQGKGGVFENLKFRAKPGEKIDEKYSDLGSEVSEFFEKARTELTKRRDEAKKEPSLWKKFNAKKAYDVYEFDADKGVIGRALKMTGTFGNEFIKTTYELDAFMGEDNKTVNIKARKKADETGLEALEKWADKKVITHLRRDPEYYSTPVMVPTACLFCDIRGSTNFSDTHSGEEVREFTNIYYKSLLTSAHDFDFTFDKFVGDEILILFGPPYDDLNPHPSMKIPVYNSINAAIAMYEKFQDIKGDYDIDAGIGIDFGLPHVGIYGDTRKQFTGMGKTFNQGARLCDEARGDNKILVSGFAYAQLINEREKVDTSNIESRLEHAGSVSVKGVSVPLEIYRVRL